MRQGNSEGILAFLYLIFGIYLLNFGFNFMKFPTFFGGINNFLLGFAGILFFIAFFRAIFYSKRRLLRRAYKL